jgi:hypothetical protein
MHADTVKIYGAGGDTWAQQVLDLARQAGAVSILDYGCGKGMLKHALDSVEIPPEARNADGTALFVVEEYDPAIPGKQTKPVHSDLVVCCDVLEHVEPDCLYSVLDDIRNISRIAVMLVVATRPAKKVLPDGRNAHLINEAPEWWIPKLMSRWKMQHFLDLGGKFVMIGRTR